MSEGSRPAWRSTFAGQLLIRYTLTIVGLLAVLGFALDRTLAATFLDDLTESLEAEAEAIQRALPAEAGALQATVAALGRDLEVRITVIRSDGVVLADSSRDPSEIENHGGRPEVRAALSGGVGVSSRTSETVGTPFRYVALPPTEGIVVRVALPLSIVDARLGRVRGLIAGGSAGAAVIGIGAVYLVSRRLTNPVRRMTESLAAISAGETGAKVPVPGAAELALLAETINRMASELGRRIEAARGDRQTRDLILSSMGDGVLLVGGLGEIAYANPAAASILGGVADTLRSIRPRRIAELAQRVLHEQVPIEEQMELLEPSRALRVSAVPVATQDRVLVVIRDVTETRRVEAIRRDFAANASHELKTPVASIQAAAETVRDVIDRDPTAARRFAESLYGDATRLSTIVADLLDLSRLETETPVLEPVRLDHVAGEEAGRFRARAEAAQVELEVRTTPTTIRGSRSDLALLVANLLDNAIQYTPAGGRVRLAADQRDGEVKLSVEDTGIGIPSRDLPRIFERFYRVDRARSRDTGGTGLGLSIARHVAEQHGGRIEVESELGRGSVFRVILPADS